MLSFFSRKPQPQAAMTPGQRVYAIGDVHGRLDLYDQLIEQIRLDNAARPPAQTLVLLLGDLIDRGPDSAAMVRRAMEPLGWARLIAIKGNHEAALLDALDGDRRMLNLWLRNGGIEAARSWGVPDSVLMEGSADEILAAVTEAISPSERTWLARLPLTIQFGGYFFAHAGVRPGVRLNDQRETDLLWIRDDFLGSTRELGAVVVHGHSVREEVEERPNRIGIDTGAYVTGRLTALGLEGSASWTVQVA
jgi:serine/threonine protein phosphatase 1